MQKKASLMVVAMPINKYLVNYELRVSLNIRWGKSSQSCPLLRPGLQLILGPVDALVENL